MLSGQNYNSAAVIISGLALILCAYNLVVLRSFNRLRKTFFAGRTGADLETIINALDGKLRSLQEEQTALAQAISRLQYNNEFAIQKVGIIRFNPFGDDGGNFSFCLALLDNHDTGIVLTSMHGRQQNRIYTKKIQNGASETALTEEEQQAITNANSKIQISNVK